ncbi:MAG: class A beta-lactamase [Pseudomonadota bacterium]
MIHSPRRRSLLLATASLPVLPFLGACTTWGPKDLSADTAEARLAALESGWGGRLGVFAIDTGNERSIGFRAGERFAFCSTFKVMLASAVLERSKQAPELLQQRITYAKSELVNYSPITEDHVDDGMSVAELCAAAIQYSDNTAANLLIKLLGGTAAVTAYARSIGDQEFRLDRWETELNTAIPGDPRDTTTPAAMGRSLRRLAVGEALPAPLRAQLQDWMRGNTTGDARIRAGVPAGWQVGDKTGTGDYASANDIGVVWPPQRAPIVLAVYTAQADKDAKANSEVIAAATRIVLEHLA